MILFVAKVRNKSFHHFIGNFAFFVRTCLELEKQTCSVWLRFCVHAVFVDTVRVVLAMCSIQLIREKELREVKRSKCVTT